MENIETSIPEEATKTSAPLEDFPGYKNRKIRKAGNSAPEAVGNRSISSDDEPLNSEEQAVVLDVAYFFTVVQ